MRHICSDEFLLSATLCKMTHAKACVDVKVP